MMDVFSLEFISSLFSIIIIDIVLAGDNALLIGLAVKDLPKHLQKKAIVWGTIGAIVVRMLLTLVAVALLKISGILLAGGVLLVYIAYKLLAGGKDHNIQSKSSFWGAIWTILVADALMGIDNAIAVAGAAHGDFLLVVIGLLISIPIVIWGSTFIIKWMERFPFIVTIGGAILAWTASKMIVKDKYVHEFFTEPLIKYGFEILVIVLVVAIGTYVANKGKKTAKVGGLMSWSFISLKFPF